MTATQRDFKGQTTGGSPEGADMLKLPRLTPDPLLVSMFIQYLVNVTQSDQYCCLLFVFCTPKMTSLTKRFAKDQQ